LAVPVRTSVAASSKTVWVVPLPADEGVGFAVAAHDAVAEIAVTAVIKFQTFGRGEDSRGLCGLASRQELLVCDMAQCYLWQIAACLFLEQEPQGKFGNNTRVFSPLSASSRFGAIFTFI
jgi:hypothetical protein